MNKQSINEQVYEHLKTIAKRDSIQIPTRVAQIKIHELAKTLTLTKHETLTAIEALQRQNRLHLNGRTKYILFD